MIATGALIGAGLSALGAAGNWFTGKKLKDKQEKNLKSDIAEASADYVNDRYGDIAFSAANNILRRGADERKDYVKQQRGLQAMGAVSGGAEDAASKGISNDVANATAQQESTNLSLAAQDKAARRQAQQNLRNLEAAGIANNAAGWQGLANAGAAIASNASAFNDSTESAASAPAVAETNGVAAPTALAKAQSENTKLKNPIFTHAGNMTQNANLLRGYYDNNGNWVPNPALKGL